MSPLIRIQENFFAFPVKSLPYKPQQDEDQEHMRLNKLREANISLAIFFYKHTCI